MFHSGKTNGNMTINLVNKMATLSVDQYEVVWLIKIYAIWIIVLNSVFL